MTVTVNNKVVRGTNNENELTLFLQSSAAALKKHSRIWVY
jgi:hypothetical protein